MAKTKQISILPKDSDDESEREEIDSEELNAEEQDILRVLSELEGFADSSWKVIRVPPLPPGKVKGYCDTLSASEFTIEEIRARFGKGKYRVQGSTSRGTFLKQVTIEIATDPPKTGEVLPAESSNKDFVQRFEERQARADERHQRMMELIIPAAIGGFTQMMAAMAGRPQSDPLLMIGALKQLAPTPPDHSALLIKLIEMAGGKEPADEPAWMGLLKTAASDLMPALAAKLQQPSAVTPAQPVPLVASRPDQPAQVAAPQPVAENPMLKLLGWARDTLAYLVQKAQKNSDPELYADWLLDSVPEGVDVMQFVQYLRQENWFTVLQQFAPAIANHKEWFEEFRESLLTAIDEIVAEQEKVNRAASTPADQEYPSPGADNEDELHE